MNVLEDELARFVTSTRLEDVPRTTIERVRILTLDAIASALAGDASEERPMIEQVAARLFGEGDSTVIAGGRLSPAGAAFLNGFKITAATICDVHRPTLTHVTPEVVPAALAAAELSDASGEDLLIALIVGCEVTVRVAQALDGPAYRERGWHNPGIAGAIGAAVAVARLEGLDEAAVGHAMGHAASQAAGTFAALGTAGVKVHQARGALSGLVAGLLAAGHVDASREALTAARGGLLAAYADGGQPERLVDGLGIRFVLEEISLRRWAAASSLQSLVAAALTARAELVRGDGDAVDLADVAQVTVHLPPRSHGLSALSGWANQLAALQSARWIGAIVLVDGDCWLDQTSSARRADEGVGHFATERIAVELDAGLPLAAARLTLRRRSGPEIVHQVDVPPGDPADPLGRTEVQAKLGRAAAAIGLADRVTDIDRLIDTMDDMPSVQPLLGLVGA